VFHSLRGVSVRKTEFHLHAIPLVDRRLRRLICRTLGHKPYGESFALIEGRQDYAAYLPIERALGPYLGCSWNITARKRA